MVGGTEGRGFRSRHLEETWGRFRSLHSEGSQSGWEAERHAVCLNGVSSGEGKFQRDCGVDAEGA